MTDKEYVVSRYQFEETLFNKVLQAVPGNNLDYRPHPKSRTGGELVAHMLGHVIDLHELLDDGIIHHRIHEPYKTIEDARKRFAGEYSRLLARLASIDNEQWNKSGVTMLVNGYQIMEGRVQDFISIFLFDSIHHRGQLCSYIRLMGGKIPGTYGPSADELEEMQKQQLAAN